MTGLASDELEGTEWFTMVTGRGLGSLEALGVNIARFGAEKVTFTCAPYLRA